jgi:hypothetical protein
VAPWKLSSTDANRWDEKSGLQRDALSSQVIDALEAQEIKEAGLLIPSVIVNRELRLSILASPWPSAESEISELPPK